MRDISSRERYIPAGPGVQLRCLEIDPAGPGGAPVVFLPGWTAPHRVWEDFIRELSKERPVVYVELRDKLSARIDADAGYTVHEMARDLGDIIGALGIDGGEYVLAGYSLGATVILEALGGGLVLPACVSVICPLIRFRLPPGVGLLRLIPAPHVQRIARRARHVADKYGALMGAQARSPGQHGPGLLSDPGRIKQTILGFRTYRLDTQPLESVDIPSLVVNASRDWAHDQDAVSTIALSLPGAQYVDLETRQACHSRQAARLVLSFAERLVSVDKKSRVASRRDRIPWIGK